MRLSATSVAEIIAGISHKCDPTQLASANLILYGSRADDQLKGGDIDLLLQVRDEATAHALRAQTHVLVNAIKAKIGDQKIDLTIRSATALQQDEFFSHALSGSIVLHQWT